jgi:hypothetical protein
VRRARRSAFGVVGALVALLALGVGFGYLPPSEKHPTVAFDVTIPSASEGRFRTEMKAFASKGRFIHAHTDFPHGAGTAIQLIRHDCQVFIDTGFGPNTWGVAAYRNRGPLGASDEEIRKTAARLSQAIAGVPGAVLVRDFAREGERAPSAP